MQQFWNRALLSWAWYQWSQHYLTVLNFSLETLFLWWKKERHFFYYQCILTMILTINISKSYRLQYFQQLIDHQLIINVTIYYAFCRTQSGILFVVKKSIHICPYHSNLWFRPIWCFKKTNKQWNWKQLCIPYNFSDVWKIMYIKMMYIFIFLKTALLKCLWKSI